MVVIGGVDVIKEFSARRISATISYDNITGLLAAEFAQFIIHKTLDMETKI